MSSPDAASRCLFTQLGPFFCDSGYGEEGGGCGGMAVARLGAVVVAVAVALVVNSNVGSNFWDPHWKWNSDSVFDSGYVRISFVDISMMVT
jgi:hypothetical protein